MDSKSISPIRASNTPKPSSSIPNFKIPRLTKRDPVSAKQSEIKSIKLEQKLTKDFIKKQKENDLKTAREKVKLVKDQKKFEKIKKLRKNLSLIKIVPKNYEKLKNLPDLKNFPNRYENNVTVDQMIEEIMKKGRNNMKVERFSNLKSASPCVFVRRKNYYNG